MRPVLPVDDHCGRCRGLMVVEYDMDLQDDAGQIGVTALRCTGCGEVVDAVILQNRVRPAPNLLYGTNSARTRSVSTNVTSDSFMEHRSS